jgi:prepilin-type N-terminal cleavage/methylation domain-containing protein
VAGSNGGFSLIEVMVALAVLAIGFAGTATLTAIHSKLITQSRLQAELDHQVDAIIAGFRSREICRRHFEALLGSLPRSVSTAYHDFPSVYIDGKWIKPGDSFPSFGQGKLERAKVAIGLPSSTSRAVRATLEIEYRLNGTPRIVTKTARTFLALDNSLRIRDCFDMPSYRAMDALERSCARLDGELKPSGTCDMSGSTLIAKRTCDSMGLKFNGTACELTP